MARRRLILGYDASSVPELPSLLHQVQSEGFDFLSVPLANSANKRDAASISTAERRTTAFTKSDLLLPSSIWTSSIVGRVSEWIWPAVESLGDTATPPSQAIPANPKPMEGYPTFCPSRRHAEDALKQELAWASHLSLPAVLFPELPSDCTNTTRLINQCVQQLPFFQVWITVPLGNPREGLKSGEDTTSHATELGEGMTPWMRWNRLRHSCEHSRALFVALEIGGDLPDDEELTRWEGEPVKVLLLSTTAFLRNKKGFPALSRRHQAVIRRFSKFNVQVMLTGKPSHLNGKSVYAQYLRHLYDQIPPLTEEEQIEGPYLDYLQAPLQPLMDNLESQTYETFERDPVKYEQYRKAVALALKDFVKQKYPSIDITADSTTKAALPEPTDCEVVIMVVGAGRGPLVRASLKATAEVNAELLNKATNVELDVRVYAVEKNPNAVVTLRSLVVSEQWENVTIVDSDMRVWSAPEKADIMVSELLGSFGDNELSPECLDGAQKYLSPNGVSIPCDYVSYLAPISAAKLWNEARHNRHVHLAASGNTDELKAMETAYVVKLHNVACLAEPQPCFAFTHPNKQWPDHIDNTRFSKLSWTLDEPATVHGLAGYFESRLYGDVYISILPDSPNFSEGMFSWFPLYFPLRQPMLITKDTQLTTSMWRAVSSNRVWYEWEVMTEYANTPIHNPNGRSYWIGL